MKRNLKYDVLIDAYVIAGEGALETEGDVARWKQELFTHLEAVGQKMYLTDPDTVLIPEIDDIDEALRRFGGGASSGVGTGGMLTKLRAAKTMSAMGIDTIIASGKKSNPLKTLAGGVGGTIVHATLAG